VVQAWTLFANILGGVWIKKKKKTPTKAAKKKHEKKTKENDKGETRDRKPRQDYHLTKKMT